MNNDILQKILFELIDIKRELRKSAPHTVNAQKKSVPPKDAEIILLGFIQKREPLTKSQLTRGLQSLGRARDIKLVLDELIADCRVKEEVIGRTTYYKTAKMS